jgi:hypothetical protein
MKEKACKLHDSDVKYQKKLNGRNYNSCASNQKAYEGFFLQICTRELFVTPLTWSCCKCMEFNDSVSLLGEELSQYRIVPNIHSLLM